MDHYQRSRPTAPMGASPMLLARIQRVRRVLGFSGQLAQALYDEFALEAHLATPSAPIPRDTSLPTSAPRDTGPLAPVPDRVALVTPFVARLAAILAQVVAGEALLDRAGTMAEAEAYVALSAFEARLIDLQADCRTLDADATALRAQLDRPPAAAAGTASLGPPGQPSRPRPAETGPLARPGAERAGGIGGWLRRVVAEATVVGDPPPPPPPPPDPAFERARHAFEAAHKFLRQALDYVGPRLAIVDLAMRITGLPAAKKPWEQIKREMPVAMFRAKLPPDAAPWVPPITQLFHESAEATRRAHVVLTQWEGARTASDEAEVLRAAVARSAPAQAASMLRAFDLPRYQAVIHPLKHVHLSFRGLPHLSALFPPPADARAASTAPLKFGA